MLSYIDMNEFDVIVSKVKASLLADKQKVILYGLYMQATAGNNDTIKPSFFDFKEKEKWKSWKRYYGLTSEEAQKMYIETALKLLQPRS